MTSILNILHWILGGAWVGCLGGGLDRGAAGSSGGPTPGWREPGSGLAAAGDECLSDAALAARVCADGIRCVCAAVGGARARRVCVFYSDGGGGRR